jgi:hypothetical protein
VSGFIGGHLVIELKTVALDILEVTPPAARRDALPDR